MAAWKIAESSDDTPWYFGEYFILTVTLLFTTVGFPFVLRVLGPFAFKTTLTALLLAALYATRDHKILFRSLMVLVVPIIAANLLVDEDGIYSYLDKVALVTTSLFLCVVLVAVFVRVIRSPRVTMDIIFGSVAVYLLFGAVVAILFQVIDLVDPGAALEGTRRAGTAVAGNYQFNDFLYFSFVSLTSLGYGDYAPAGPAARSLAMFEGVFGQLYIAILIARLVGLHTSQK